MKRTNVLFVGGPRDGQRQVVDSLPMVLIVPAWRPEGEAAIPSEGAIGSDMIGHQYRITHMAEDAAGVAIYADASLQGGQVIAALAGQYVAARPADSIQAINERNAAEKHAPEVIVAAAYQVGKWFADRGVAGWQLGPCADRSARLVALPQLPDDAPPMAPAMLALHSAVDSLRIFEQRSPARDKAIALVESAIAAMVTPAECRNEIINSGAQAIPKSCPRCGLSKECAAGVQPWPMTVAGWNLRGFVVGATVRQDFGRLAGKHEGVIECVHSNGALDVRAGKTLYGWTAKRCEVVTAPAAIEQKGGA